MPKINVYLPDELAESVRETGVPVSPICQRALEQSIKQVQAIRQAVAGDLLAEDNQAIEHGLRIFTARTMKTIEAAVARAQEHGAGTVGTGDLLAGILVEGRNLALQVLLSMDIAVATLDVPSGPAEPGGGPGLRFSKPAAAALEAAVLEATTLGHNYVGTEHLLIALAATPAGQAAKVLHAAGADVKPVRRAVNSALAGYAHLRSALPTVPTAGLTAALRQELQPLVERIERLEARN